MVRPALVLATVAVLLFCVAVEAGPSRVRRDSGDEKGENNFAKCLEDSTNLQEALDCLSQLLGIPINQNCHSGVLREHINDEKGGGSPIPSPMDDAVPFPIQPGTGGKIAKKVDEIAEKIKHLGR